MLSLVRCIADLSWVTFARLLSSSFSVMAGARALVQETGVVPRCEEDDDGFFSSDDEDVQDKPVSEAVFQAWVHLRTRVCLPLGFLKGVEKEGR